MDTTIIAWLVLRIVYAWLYLYALKALLSDWQGTKQLVGILTPYYQGFFASLMVVVMLVSGLMILLGFYAQIAGVLLLIYNLVGAYVHYQLARLIGVEQLSKNVNEADKTIFIKVQTMGMVGHVTSAQKNFVLAAVALFFVLFGSGPWSLTAPLW